MLLVGFSIVRWPIVAAELSISRDESAWTRFDLPSNFRPRSRYIFAIFRVLAITIQACRREWRDRGPCGPDEPFARTYLDEPRTRPKRRRGDVRSSRSTFVYTDDMYKMIRDTKRQLEDKMGPAVPVCIASGRSPFRT